MSRALGDFLGCHQAACELLYTHGLVHLRLHVCFEERRNELNSPTILKGQIRPALTQALIPLIRRIISCVFYCALKCLFLCTRAHSLTYAP
jgi:hypothetical protein